MPKLTRKNDPARPELPQRTAGPLSVRTLTLRVRPDRRQARLGERRNVASREALLRRIEVEYRDMPGLRLTRAQAQRLFGLREDICVRVLDALVQARILRIDPSGSFVRNGAFP
jgi:hypothetical protein